ncbi:MAG: TonB-dependent receptor [Prolixibacteraceae bacterium]|jgi:TonB-linked SusC/RagA family outer membrane protein|nr:TonB-dependent receptor [Prolixibacteraceae bacterium]
MKKSKANIPLLQNIGQIVRIMKITAVLVFVLSIHSFANTYGQNIKINISMENATFKEVIERLEKESGYYVVIKYDQTLLEKKVDVDFQNLTVTEILDGLLKDTGLGYKIIDRYIAISKISELNSASQQQKSVSGKVTDSSGGSLPGVSVVVKGTTTGVITDRGGNYTLTNIPENATLQFSFVGMKMQDVVVGSKTTINVSLEEETVAIEEVVAVGYGTQKKINLSGAVSKVDSKVLESRPIANLGQGLQGTIPGLNITQNNGSLGQGASFNIRGATSLNGGGPLILVNGVPMDINMINPSDIDNVTVLKDGSSAAIYGARAAYGVMLVTTKSGKKKDRPSVSLSSNYSINQPLVKLELMDVMERMAFYNEASMRQSGALYYAFNEYAVPAITAHYNDPTKPEVFKNPTTDPTLWSGCANTNWPRELLRDTYPMQQHTVSISGASDKFNYYTSLGYFYQEGTAKHFNEYFERYNFSANLNYDILKWFRIGTKVNLNSSYKNFSPRGLLDGTYMETQNNFQNQLWPQLPVYFPDGNYAAFGGNVPNVVQIEEQGGYRKRDINENWVTGLIKLTPVRHLTINMDYSTNFSFTKNIDYRKVIPVYNALGVPYILNNYFTTSSVTRNVTNSKYYAFNAYTEYENTFNRRHYFKGMIGFNQESSNSLYFQAKRENLMVETMPYMSLASGLQFGTDSETEYAIRGAFSRLNYSFDNRYFLEFNGRYDGASKFSKKDRFAFFPSGSAAWRIDNEAFFAGLKKSINLLKIRGSYSTLGNQSVSGNYPYIANYGTAQIAYLLNGATPMTVTAPGLVSPSLTWETVSQRNLGLDFAVLDNKLTGEFDIYRRDTKNMLTRSQTLPAVLAVTEPQANAGDMKTNGFELTLNWSHRINKVKYGVTVTLADYTSKITKYSNPNGIISDYYVGRDLGEIWGLVTGGYFKTDAEATALNQTAISGRKRMAGDIWFVDLDGDSKITRGNNTLANPGDQKIIGNNTPHFSYSFRPNLEWNGFDLELFFQGIAKRDVVLGNTLFLDVYTNEWTTQSKVLADFWTPENPNAYFPRPLFNIGTDVTAVQTHFLQNGAYLRLKQLTLGYTIPSFWTRKIGIEKARIYFSGNNLWTHTKMIKISDPEMVNAMDYPLNKSISFGLNIDL